MADPNVIALPKTTSTLASEVTGWLIVCSEFKVEDPVKLAFNLNVPAGMVFAVGQVFDTFTFRLALEIPH